MNREYKSANKNIQKYLSNARKRLKSAEILINNGNFNDAISRVYYAFFDAASAALLSKNIFVKTHKGLEMMFDKHFINTGEFPGGVGRWLGRARVAREQADYELWKKFSKEQVEVAIKAAKEFVKTVEEKIKN